MAELLEDVISAVMMRDRIRAKIQAGTSRRSISMLILEYTPAAAPTDREHDTGVRRVPIEAIPHWQRAGFLIAPDRLAKDPAAQVILELEFLSAKLCRIKTEFEWARSRGDEERIAQLALQVKSTGAERDRLVGRLSNQRFS